MPRQIDIRRSDPFTLGVASGYPEPGAVVLWTRLAPEPLAPGGGMPREADAVPVDWEVAEDDGFRRIRRSGRTYATPDWAHSVHVEVAGLEPGRDYWYRFTSGGARSPVGHTRTAPVDPRSLKLAVASCQQYEGGHYAAYAAMARDDLDLVLHVGDYIYEMRGRTDRVRSHDTPECYTLDDYRLRYAIYKSDAQLQAAHGGLSVDGHLGRSRGRQRLRRPPFARRRCRGTLPRAPRGRVTRPTTNTCRCRARLVPFGPHQRLHARRGFGELAEIWTLDGRQYRSVHACGTGLVNPCSALYAEERTMLGAQQEHWLGAGLQRSRARWKLLAQQTVFAHMDQAAGPDTGYWSDGWSGYPAARQRLVDFIAERNIANPLVLSGDIHAFLANDVHARPGDPDTPIVATEFVTTSISSPGPRQAVLDSWAPENSNVRFARGEGARLRAPVARCRGPPMRNSWVVDDVSRADSGTHVVTTFDVAAGEPGLQVPDPLDRRDACETHGDAGVAAPRIAATGRRLLLPGQDVRDDGRAAAADVLRHRDFRFHDLVAVALAGELLRRVDDLVDAACADRMAASLEPAHRRDRQPARRCRVRRRPPPGLPLRAARNRQPPGSMPK